MRGDFPIFDVSKKTKITCVCAMTSLDPFCELCKFTCPPNQCHNRD